MNLVVFSDFKVLVDYAHNPHAVAALGTYIQSVSACEKIGVIAGIETKGCRTLLT